MLGKGEAEMKIAPENVKKKNPKGFLIFSVETEMKHWANGLKGFKSMKFS